MKLVKKLIISTVAVLVSYGVNLPASASMEMPDPEEKPTFKVVLLGNPGVEKTSLFGKLCCDDFEFGFDTNILNDCKKVESVDDFNLMLWETVGQEAYRSLTPFYIKNTHAAIIVLSKKNNYETNSKQFFYWYDFIKEYASDAIVLCVLSDKKDNENHENTIKLRELCYKNKIFFVEVSPKTGEGIEAMLDYLVYALKENKLKQVNPKFIKSGKHEFEDCGDYFSCC